MRSADKVAKGSASDPGELYRLIPANTVPTRSTMIEALIHLARQSEAQGQLSNARAALSEASTMLGYMGPEQAGEGEAPDDEEERKRLIVEAALELGMVWPGNEQPKGGGDHEADK